MQVQSLGQEDPLEEGMATHSSILAQRIPWTEEPGGLQSTGSHSQTRLNRLSTHAQVKDATYNLKYTGQSILQAPTSKGIPFFHSYSD